MSYPKVIQNILQDKYVSDSKSRGNTVEEVKKLKWKCEESFKKGSFKWYFNTPTWENTATSNELTHAKWMFQTSLYGIKILGVLWNKLTDKLSISVLDFQQTVVIRNILNYVTSIYFPLGIIPSCHIFGKFICNKLCDDKILSDV